LFCVHDASLHCSAEPEVTFLKEILKKNYPLLLKHNGGALGKINVQLRNDLAYLKMG
jgi:hypothetical protein